VWRTCNMKRRRNILCWIGRMKPINQLPLCNDICRFAELSQFYLIACIDLTIWDIHNFDMLLQS
jgi:hypothetical protein